MARIHDEKFWRAMEQRALVARMHRRQFLRYIAAASAGVVSLGALAACGDDDEETGSGATATRGSGSTPAAGGTSAVGSPVTGSPSTGGSGGGFIGFPAGYDNKQKWAGREIVVASFGGALQDAQREAIFSKFAEATGCTVKEDASDTGKLRTMVDAGAVEWDVMETEISSIKSLADAKLVEPIDYNIVDKTGLSEEAAIEHTVGAFFWSTIMTYNTEIFPSGGPGSWADFWDTSKFEGKRSLNNSPLANLEFAVMADGVAMEDVYPIDIERAYASLDKIKDAISVWWEQGAQPPQLVDSKEVSMSSAWSGRIFAAAKEGAKVAPTWNQGVVTFDCWVVPKGTKNKDVAMDFINFATRAEPSAHQSTIIPYGPINSGAFEFLSDDQRKLLPSEPELKAMQVVADYEWWWENYDEQVEKFADWLLA